MGNEWLSPSWSPYRERPVQAGLVAWPAHLVRLPVGVSSSLSAEAFGAAKESILVDGGARGEIEAGRGLAILLPGGVEQSPDSLLGWGDVAGVGENWALAACSRHLSGEPRDSSPESHACPWLRIHFYQGTLVFWVRQVGLLMMSQACTE